MGRLIRNGTEYCGGGGDNSKTMSYAEYQNLSEIEKNSDTTFYIPDYPGTGGAVSDCILRSDIVDDLESNSADLPLSANMGRELKNELDSFTSDQLLGSHMYYGHWIYDGNSATPLLFIPLPTFHQKYDVTVDKISVQGINEYTSNIIVSSLLNGLICKHSSVTGTTHVGKLGLATLTFTEKTT